MVNSGPERCSKFVSADEGHRVALAVPNVKLSELLGLSPVLALGLHVHLPLAAKTVEVVDEVGAHEGLQRSVHVGELYPLLRGPCHDPR